MLALWSPKGGVGTSVLAAAVALAVARDVRAGRVPGCELAGRRRRPRSAWSTSPAISPRCSVSGPIPRSASATGWRRGPTRRPTRSTASASRSPPGLVLLPRGVAVADAPAAAGAALAHALRDGSGPRGRRLRHAPPARRLRAFVEAADTTLVVLRPCYLASAPCGARRAARRDRRCGRGGGTGPGAGHPGGHGGPRPPGRRRRSP